MADDYYKLLGVEKTSSADDIKKAYRKLALRYHPDRNPSDKKGSEEKFKKISEAYAVLSDSEKRKEYDNFGSEAFGQRFTQEDIFRGVDINDILRDLGFGGGGFSFFSRGGPSGGRSRVYTQRARGGDPFAEYYGEQGHFGPQPAQKGQDLDYNLAISLDDAFNGAEKTLSIRTGSETQEIKVKIPPGINNGQKLRIPAKGSPGAGGGPPGDIYLNIQVASHPFFSREGDDLLTEIPVKFSQAALGSTIDVPTISSQTKRIKVPAGTQNDTRIRMRGYGMPRFRGSGKGDLFVKIKVSVPKRLSDKQQELVKKLAEEGF